MQVEVRYMRFGGVPKRWHHANMTLRIRMIRKERGLTGEQLAEMVGVSKGYISEIETGKKTPGAGLMLRLAEALRVEVYDLYEGTEDERRNASLKAHMDVMAQLSDEQRLVIEKAALGFLTSKP